MKDPERLIREADPRVRALLRVGATDGPGKKSQRRLMTALGVGPVAVAGAWTAGEAAASAAAPGQAALAAATTAGAGTAAGAVFGVKWIVAVAAIGVAAAGAAGLSGAPPASVPVTAPMAKEPALPPPTAAVTMSHPPIATPAPLPSSPPSARTPTSDRRVAAPSSREPAAPLPLPPITEPSALAPTSPRNASALLAETTLLGAARDAITAGDAPNATRALDDYDRAFPSGMLAPEAAALRVEALALAGDRAGARRLADRFLTDYPTSPLVPRVRTFVDRTSTP